MSHMGNLKLNQPANLIFSGNGKNKALNNFTISIQFKSFQDLKVAMRKY